MGPQFEVRSHTSSLRSLYTYVCVCVSFQAYTRRRLWSDRDQIWHTHADSPRKGSGKNNPEGNLWGFRGPEIKFFGKLPNGWTNWHQIWHTYADSSGNGHRLKPISPSMPQGAFGGGGVRGSQNATSLENLPNGWTDWHQIWYTSADSSGNGHRLKTISPSISQGAFWGFQGSKMQKSGKSTKRLDRLAPNLVHVCGFIWEWT